MVILSCKHLSTNMQPYMQLLLQYITTDNHIYNHIEQNDSVADSTHNYENVCILYQEAWICMSQCQNDSEDFQKKTFYEWYSFSEASTVFFPRKGSVLSQKKRGFYKPSSEQVVKSFLNVNLQWSRNISHYHDILWSWWT